METMTGTSLSPTPQQGGHVRAYQACNNCRKRKSKCDLGDRDNPQPPCERCRREMKDCRFTSDRRKTSQGDHDGSDDEGEFSVKRAKSESYTADPSSPGFGRPRALSNSHPTPRTAGERSYFLRRTDSSGGTDTDEEDPKAGEETIAQLQRTRVENNDDAVSTLRTLGKGAGKMKRNRPDGEHAGNRNVESGNTRNRANSAENGYMTSNNTGSFESESGQRVDTNPAWLRMRFVTSGWFSPAEGTLFVNHFYDHLLPLTPVTIPDYRDPSLHGRLLAEEPILAVTLLAIASRYIKVSGHGSRSRTFSIHNQLSKHLQNSITRIIFAQEKVRADFRSSDPSTATWARSDSKGNLRSLGTIESLLLLTEWHSRALHFPPADGYHELLLGDGYAGEGPGSESNEDSRERKRGDWYEPVWRSERMSWSLLSIAHGLALELGVFDEVTDAERGKLENEGKSQLIERKENIRRLLFIYITQTSGRLSIKSMLPDMGTDPFFNLEGSLDQAVDLSASSPGLEQQVVLYFWAQKAAFVRDITREMFLNRELTRRLIHSGEYVELVKEHGKKLTALKEKLDECNLIPERMRHILNIEYETTRVKLFDIALQAVFQRVRDYASQTSPAGEAIPGPDNAGTKAFSPLELRQCCEGNRAFITDLVQSGQNVLRSVTSGLKPNEGLVHAPVRVYFRIVFVAMALLRCFAVAQTAKESRKTLPLLEKAACDIQNHIVDDIHVGGSMAAIILHETRQVHRYLIRVSKQNNRATPSGSTAPTPAPRQSTRNGSTSDTPSSAIAALPNQPNFQSDAWLPSFATAYEQPMPGQAETATQLVEPALHMHNFMQSGSPYFFGNAVLHPNFESHDPLDSLPVQTFDPTDFNTFFVPDQSTMSQYPMQTDVDDSINQNHMALPASNPEAGTEDDWVTLPFEPTNTMRGQASYPNYFDMFNEDQL